MWRRVWPMLVQSKSVAKEEVARKRCGAGDDDQRVFGSCKLWLRENGENLILCGAFDRIFGQCGAEAEVGAVSMKAVDVSE